MSRQELLTASGLRRDNRRALELRQVDFAIHDVPPAGADGAASVSHGLTRVTALVHGPREARSGPSSGVARVDTRAGGSIAVTVLATPFAGQERRKMGRSEKRNFELAAAIANSFEPVVMLSLYPRSSIDISVHVVQSDGGLLQAAINATSLALVGAGIALTDTVAALTVCSLPSPPTLLLDPSSSEEGDLPSVTVAALPRTSTVTLAQLEDRISADRFEDMVRIGIEACAVLRQTLEREVGRWSQRMARTDQSQLAS